MNFGMDGAWGTWVNRWTAEENRHGIALRDYLVVTRAVDPVELERLRMSTCRGFSPRDHGDSLLHVDSPTSRSRSWPPACRTATPASCTEEPIAEQLLARIAADENLHMIFYRDVVQAAPRDRARPGDAARHRGARNFKMPGSIIPGFRRKAVDDRRRRRLRPALHLDDVVRPVLRQWRVFELEGLSPCRRPRCGSRH